MALFCILNLDTPEVWPIKPKYEAEAGLFSNPEQAFEYINKQYIVEKTKFVIAPVSQYIQDNFITPGKYVVVCDYEDGRIYGLKVMSKLPLMSFKTNRELREKLTEFLGCKTIWDIVYVGKGMDKSFGYSFGVENL